MMSPAALDASGDVGIVIEPEDKLVAIASKLATTLGYRQEEMVGRRWRDFIVERDHPRMATALESLFAGRDIEPLECGLTTRDGQRRWLRLTARSAHPDGRAQLVGRDITDEILERVDRWRLTESLKRIEQGLVLTDREGRLVWCNDVFASMCEYTKDELVGRKLGPLLRGPDSDPEEAARIRAAVADERPFRSEILNYAKSGRPYWVALAAEPVVDPLGHPQFLAVATDVTRAHAQQAALREAEGRYRATFNGSQSAIYWLRARRDEAGHIEDFTFVDVNPAGERELGMSRDRLMGHGICELFPVNRDGGFFEQYKTVAETRNPLEQEYEIRPPHRAPGHYRQTVLAVQDGVAIFNEDITPRKVQEAAKARLDRELQQDQKMKALGRLAGGVAHDFNNILLGINLVCGQLQRLVADNAAARGLVHEVEDNTQRAMSLVKQILTFVRDSNPVLTATRIAPRLHDLLRSFSRVLPSDVRLAHDLDEDVVLDCAAEQMERVLTNLLTNALYAVDGRPGEIFVQLRRQPTRDLPASLRDLGEEVNLLTVKDNGIGMSEDLLEQVFEPFFTTRTEGLGNGLGLTIVHGIVSNHGGRITIDSQPGQGTQVLIGLPLSRQPTRPEDRHGAARHERQTVG